MRQAVGSDKSFCDLSTNAHHPKTHRLRGTRVRAIFISDVHLGTSASQADSLLCFLRTYQTDAIYLVGDIFYGWRLLRRRPLPQTHLTVVAGLLARARAGVRVVYIPGNHDECLRQFVGLTAGGIEITDTTIHNTASGRRYLVLHGDELDRVVQRVPWMALIGNWAYRASLAVNNITLMQGRLGSYHRVALARAKLKIRSMVNSIGHSHELLAAEATRLGVDGVICGHTHDAASCHLADINYLNTGDWVESCTGIIEDLNGRLSVVRWAGSAGTGIYPEPVDLGGIRPAEDDALAAA